MERLAGVSLNRSCGIGWKTVFSVVIVLASCFCTSLGIYPDDDACSMYDSCRVKQFFRTCSCEDDCHRYSTCCKDAEKFQQMSKNREIFQCYARGTPSPVFAKRTCSEAWDGDQTIRDACEAKASINMTTDFMSQVLVSSNRTETTYWNWNCALCNDEQIHDLIFWTVQVSCFVDGLETHLTIPHAKNNMAYNETGRHWGVMVEEEKFLPCSVTFFQPAFMMGRLRLCAPDIISSCPPDWRDASTREKCLSYHGERKIRNTGIYFKNAHCAICNGFSASDLECFGRNYRSVTHEEDSRVLKIVFNLNPWTGEHSQEDKDCRIKDRRYDPFLRVCRDLSLGITNVTQASFDYEFLIGTGTALSSTPLILALLILAVLNPLCEFLCN